MLRMFKCIKIPFLTLGLLGLPSFVFAQNAVEVPDARYTFNLNTSRPVPEPYLNRLMELFKMGRYGMDPLDISACNNPDLKSISAKAELSAELTIKVKQKIEGLDGEALWRLINDVAIWSSDLFEAPDFQLGASGLTLADDTAELLEQQSSVIIYLVLEAARKGHVDALNEVGAAQLYCYNFTRQDIPAAVHALERASQTGDPLAKMSLGKIYSSGLGGYLDVEKGHKLEDEAFQYYIQDLAKIRSKTIK